MYVSLAHENVSDLIPFLPPPLPLNDSGSRMLAFPLYSPPASLLVLLLIHNQLSVIVMTALEH